MATAFYLAVKTEIGEYRGGAFRWTSDLARILVLEEADDYFIVDEYGKQYTFREFLERVGLQEKVTR